MHGQDHFPNQSVSQIKPAVGCPGDRICFERLVPVHWPSLASSPEPLCKSILCWMWESEGFLSLKVGRAMAMIMFPIVYQLSVALEIVFAWRGLYTGHISLEPKCKSILCWMWVQSFVWPLSLPQSVCTGHPLNQRCKSIYPLLDMRSKFFEGLYGHHHFSLFPNVCWLSVALVIVFAWRGLYTGHPCKSILCWMWGQSWGSAHPRHTRLSICLPLLTTPARLPVCPSTPHTYTYSYSVLACVIV